MRCISERNQIASSEKHYSRFFRSQFYLFAIKQEIFLHATNAESIMQLKIYRHSLIDNNFSCFVNTS